MALPAEMQPRKRCLDPEIQPATISAASADRKPKNLMTTRTCVVGLSKATLNKSLAARLSLFWAVCGVANPRHSWAMAVVRALQPIPNQGAHTREDLFSIALTTSLLVGVSK